MENLTPLQIAIYAVNCPTGDDKYVDEVAQMIRKFSIDSYLILSNHLTDKLVKDINGDSIFIGDKIGFTLPFQTSDFYWDVSPRYMHQGYSSQDGFTGIVSFDKKLLQFCIDDIKFEKGLTNADYCFMMNKESWTKKELSHYFSITKRPLCVATKIFKIK